MNAANDVQTLAELQRRIACCEQILRNHEETYGPAAGRIVNMEQRVRAQEDYTRDTYTHLQDHTLRIQSLESAARSPYSWCQETLEGFVCEVAGQHYEHRATIDEGNGLATVVTWKAQQDTGKREAPHAT